MRIKIFIDGSCYYKTGQGGAGVYITTEDNAYYISQGFKETTISRMEGMALLLALRTLSKDQVIEASIYSDSEYIVKTFTENRLTKWMMIGWDRIKNVDLWKVIMAELQLRPLLRYKFHHVRGHQLDLDNELVIGNNIADKLADFRIHKVYNKDTF